MRHRSKSRIKPRPRPHRKQRLTARVLNFGVFLDRAMTDFFAIYKNKALVRAGRIVAVSNSLVNAARLTYPIAPDVISHYAVQTPSET